MSPSMADHIIVLFLMVGIPLYATGSYRRFKRAVRTGAPGSRSREYWKGISRQWVVALGLLFYWRSVGRAFTDLGLVVPADSRSLWGLAVTLLVLSFLLAQYRSVRGLSQETLAGLAAQTESVADLLPRSVGEAKVFRVLAFTAGTCEEILYRGFLIAYLASYFGLWPAVLVAGVAFGVAHAYQGAIGILKTGIVGVLAGSLLVATGSLVWPMILHTAVDLHGGAIGRRIVLAASEVEGEPVA